MRLTFIKQVVLFLLALIFYWSNALYAGIPELIRNSNKTFKISKDFTFAHPGILHNAEDLVHIKNFAFSRNQPYKKAYEIFKQNTVTSYDNKIAYADVYRGDGVIDISARAMSAAAGIAYRNALMWTITGDITYANIAKDILNSWSSTLQTFSGAGAKLIAAWYGFPMVNAAEILRHTDSGWSQADIQQTEHMFRDVIYPVIENFQRGWAGNWDTAITRCIMGIGIFLDDETIFNKGVDFLSSTTDNANGTLKNYIYDTGQCWESGRDQEHTQFGLIGLADACEIGVKQGLDLYSLYNNKLLKGFEYTAKYNLGYDVPYTANHYGSVISDIERGNFLPGYEMVYNHYFNRKAVPLNEVYYTKRVLDKIRFAQGTEAGTTITLGFGSLLYNNPAATADDESSFTYVPAEGDYRTAIAASSAGTPSQFEVYTSGRWVAATAAIGQATPLLVRDGHSLVVAGARNVKNIIVGEGWGAKLKANVVGGSVSSIDIVAPGRLNSIPPLYFVNGGQDAGSTAVVASITKVNVTGGDIKDAGQGYTTANVTFSGGGGSGATATAVIVDGKIVGINITNPGTDYTSIPTIAITGNGTGAQVTAKVGITEVTISNGGSGYTVAPTIIAGTFIKISKDIALTVAEIGGVSFQKGASIYTEGGIGILNIRRGSLTAEDDVNFISATHNAIASLNVNLGSNTNTATTHIISGKNFTFSNLGIGVGGKATVKIDAATVTNIAGNIPIFSTSMIDATEGTIGFVNTTPYHSVGRNIQDNTFKDATVNKIVINSTAGVTLNQELKISALDLQSGLLNIPATSQLQVSTVSGGNSNSYINTLSESSGAIAKVVLSGVAAQVNIPLGNGGNYLPVSITPQSASNFELSVLAGLTANGLPNGSAVADKSKFVDAAYHLKRTNGTDDFTIKLGFPESLKGSNFSSPFIAAYNGITWSNATGSGNNTDNYATATFNNNNANIYRVETDNTLPLKFVSIGVKAIDNYHSAEVSWKTLDEVAVQGFEVQRSADGKNFQTIGSIKSDGSRSYKYIDGHLLAGTSYYRIKSIELNGHDAEFSPIAPLSVKLGQNNFSVYPNPVKGDGFSVQLTEEFLKGMAEINFILVDITGRTLTLKNKPKSGQNYNISIPNGLSNGAYQLIIQNKSARITKPLLILR